MERSPDSKRVEYDRSITNMLTEKFDEAFFMDLNPDSTQTPAILSRTGPDGQGINSITLEFESKDGDSATYVVLCGLGMLDIQDQAQPDHSRELIFTIHRSNGIDKTIPYFADNDCVVAVYSDGHIEPDSDEFKGPGGAERLLTEISLAKIVK